MQRMFEAPSRRQIVMGGGSVLALGAVGAFAPIARAQSASAPAEVPVAELMQPGPLPELTLGNKDAKVTVVEYASMTCGHCANFHKTVYPELKQRYIDTGKIYFVMREFPLDNLAAAAAMLARCAGDDKTFPLISVLFEKQGEWVVRGNPVPKLFEIAKQAGFTQETFDKCLTDQALLEKISQVRARANDTFGVNSTPTFFINGKRLQGRSDQFSTFEQAIEPLLQPA